MDNETTLHNCTIIGNLTVLGMTIKPTALLKFVDGKLHQQWVIQESDNWPRTEWRIVPSEDTHE